MIKLKILYTDEFLCNIEREKPLKSRLFENSQILNMSVARANLAEDRPYTVLCASVHACFHLTEVEVRALRSDCGVHETYPDRVAQWAVS